MLSFTAAAVTTAEAAAYIAARGLTGWPVATGDQTTALRRGQDYIAREFNARWLTVDPVTLVDLTFTDATAPTEVKYAIIEAALYEAKNPGALSVVTRPADAKVLTGVKGITWTPLVTNGGAVSMKPTMTALAGLLASLIGPAYQDVLRV